MIRDECKGIKKYTYMLLCDMSINFPAQNFRAREKKDISSTVDDVNVPTLTLHRILYKWGKKEKNIFVTSNVCVAFVVPPSAHSNVNLLCSLLP